MNYESNNKGPGGEYYGIRRHNIYDRGDLYEGETGKRVRVGAQFNIETGGGGSGLKAVTIRGTSEEVGRVRRAVTVHSYRHSYDPMSDAHGGLPDSLKPIAPQQDISAV